MIFPCKASNFPSFGAAHVNRVIGWTISSYGKWMEMVGWAPKKNLYPICRWVFWNSPCLFFWELTHMGPFPGTGTFWVGWFSELPVLVGPMFSRFLENGKSPRENRRQISVSLKGWKIHHFSRCISYWKRWISIASHVSWLRRVYPGQALRCVGFLHLSEKKNLTGYDADGFGFDILLSPSQWSLS